MTPQPPHITPDEQFEITEYCRPTKKFTLHSKNLTKQQAEQLKQKIISGLKLIDEVKPIINWTTKIGSNKPKLLSDYERGYSMACFIISNHLQSLLDKAEGKK